MSCKFSNEDETVDTWFDGSVVEGPLLESDPHTYTLDFDNGSTYDYELDPAARTRIHQIMCSIKFRHSHRSDDLTSPTTNNQALRVVGWTDCCPMYVT